MANIPMKDIQFPGLDDTYTFAQVDATLTTQGKAADAKKTGDEISELKNDLNQVDTALESKANIDGYYESMTVGNAEQLVATVGIEDKVPYLFRTSGGSADIGDREVDKIVGGTVAWNQLFIKNGTYGAYGLTTNTVDGKLTISGETTGSGNREWIIAPNSYSIPSGHVVAVLGTPADFRFRLPGASYTETGKDAIFKVGSNASNQLVLGQRNMVSGVEYNVSCYPQIIDLTLMFGSTIADYIYGLETANAGDGVAWFKKLFPKDYYERNTGTLKSVEGLTSHKMTGFNQWDEEWEVGTFNTTTGANLNVSNQIRSKNIIKILPNTTYYWNSPVYNWTILYDVDGNVIPTPNVSNTGSDARSGNSFSIAAKHTFTTPANAYGMRFYTGTYTGEYKNNICINLSWDGERDGEYEEYKAYTYPLDDSLTLRGIPKLDSDNKLYYDGDTYEADGTVTRRFAELKFGTEITSNPNTWFSADETKETWGFYYNYNSSGAQAFPYNIKAGQIVSDKFIKVSSAYAEDAPYIMGAVYTTGTNGYIAFRIPKSAIATPSDSADLTSKLVAWIQNNPFTVVAELATPTTETADPFQSPQIVDDFGTEEYVLANDAFPMPVGHETTYQANLRAKLEMSPDSPSDGDGDYIVRQTDGENAYVKLVIPTELPTNPTEAGTYSLKVTVPASGTPTLAWVADT